MAIILRYHLFVQHTTNADKGLLQELRQNSSFHKVVDVITKA